MAGQLDGKVALVTGGSSGIGRATALAFAREGAKVVVADVIVDGGQETVRLLTAAGGQGLFVKTDVSKAAEVEALIKQTVATYGRLDCAFNNAGVEGAFVSTAEYTEADWDRVLAINLKGVWLCMKYEIAQMLRQGGGAIVNTASGAGLVGVPGLSAYVASKHGVVGLTKTAALECAKAGVRVNAVCPGVIQTPMVARLTSSRPDLSEALVAAEPMGRTGKPEEVAEAVVWLCSDAASFVTGHAMSVDGGYVAQ
ncbi:MAG: SDR family oxidoreductase [Thermodesulfobacteriota bacterium]|jgi:NAD(P)-dependent dehydrogenase (short-subunit alcohol dehydrogenase family)